MFKIILKSLSAVSLSILALLLTSFSIESLRQIIYPQAFIDISLVEPINILGLIFIILAVKLPSLVVDFRPGKSDLQNKLIVISVIVTLFTIFSLFTGDLIKVFLDRVIPTISQTLYKEVGIWEALFLILIFNIVKNQFD